MIQSCAPLAGCGGPWGSCTVWWESWVSGVSRGLPHLGGEPQPKFVRDTDWRMGIFEALDFSWFP